MGCPFCVTGRYGFHGNLRAGEIVNQVIGLPVAEKVTHVVFMGMGEPMDNLRDVLNACEIITSEWGLAISPRNVTVSTVGIIPGVTRFLDESNCNLTLSLYSPFPGERLKVIPAEKSNPFREILEVMQNSPVKKKRRMSIAYVMVSGINDSESHLQELKNLLAGTGIRINLLPYHPAGDTNVPSPPQKMQYFKHNLMTSGISASIRKSRGADISAACGLLAAGLFRRARQVVIQ
jgi:23S rRNA (adenine2503-C2)-methyltransferase